MHREPYVPSPAMLAANAEKARPYTVTVGCSVALLATAVDLMLLGLEFLGVPSGTAAGLFWLAAFAAIVPVAGSVGAYAGRNWGRILLLAVCAVDASFLFADDGSAVAYVPLVLFGLASALLFVPMSRVWYREQPKEA